jgi:hypothetical protein
MKEGVVTPFEKAIPTPFSFFALQKKNSPTPLRKAENKMWVLYFD